MQQIGSYRVVKRLSSDGFGELHDAVDEQTQRHALIKIMHQDLAADRLSAKRFLNEVKAVNCVDHPGIVKIYDHGELPTGAPYIVMEYLNGETLRDRLRQLGGRMEPQKAMRIAGQVASALAAAHATQVVHRDLKPGNIMLVADAQTPEGERVKLLGFGIAKLSPSANSSPLTKVSDMMGTPTYMSPEQCKSARDVTDRSDVYSVGVMLYEMLAGAPPFSDTEGLLGLMTAHIQQDPPSLKNRAPDAGPELCVLVNRMLAKSPADRPSAEAVASLLSQLSGQGGLPLSPALLASPSPPPLTATMIGTTADFRDASAREPTLRRRRADWLIFAGATLAVVLGLIGVLSAVREIRRSATPPPPTKTLGSIDMEPPRTAAALPAATAIGPSAPPAHEQEQQSAKAKKHEKRKHRHDRR